MKIFIKFTLLSLVLVLTLEGALRFIQGYKLDQPALKKNAFFSMDVLKIWNEKFVRSKDVFFRWPVQLETFSDSDLTPRYIFKANQNKKITALKECGKFLNFNNSEEISWSSNSQGLRGKEFAVNKSAGNKRIVALGASTTEGTQNDSETYPVYLEQELERQGFPAELINAGHHGYGLEDILVFFKERIIPLEPDFILFYEAANSVSPQEWFKEWNGWNSWPEAYPAIFSIPSKHSLIFTKFAGIFNMEKRVPPKRDFIFSDIDYEISPSLTTYKDNLLQLINTSKKNGIQPILMTFVTAANPELELKREQNVCLWEDLNLKWYPFTAAQISRIYDAYNRTLTQVAISENISFFDIAPIFPKDISLFADHIHFTSKGNQLLAKLISEMFIKEVLRATPKNI